MGVRGLCDAYYESDYVTLGDGTATLTFAAPASPAPATRPRSA